jgi:hypothetical protein
MLKTKLNMTVASALMVGGMVAVLSTSAQAAVSRPAGNQTILAGSSLCMARTSGPTAGGCADAALTGTINYATGQISLGANTFFDTPFSINSTTMYSSNTTNLGLLGVTQAVADAAGAASGLPAGSLKAYDMTVGNNQLGASMLFTWGSNTGMRVISLWNVTDDLVAGTRTLTAVDATVLTDGIVGAKMVEVFTGQSPNFNIVTTIPVPAAAWLFGSGLLGLVGVARRRNKAAA